MTEYAVRLTNGADTAPRMRMADALGLAPGDGPLAARSGLRPGSGGVVTVVDGAMQVQVAPFSCWVDGGSSTTQGGYPFLLDATKTLAIADGAALQARVDTIAVVIHDDTFDGSGDTSASVQVLQGVAGGAAPALPVTAIPLFDVNVPAGASAGTGGLSASDLGSDRRSWTAGLGGIIPVSGAGDRDALTEVYAGLTVYREDTDRVQVWNGAAWDTYAPDSDSGWQTRGLSAGWTAAGSGVHGFKMRRRNGVVYVEAEVQRTGADVVGGGYVDVATVPSGWEPDADLVLSGTSGQSDTDIQVKIATDGTVQLRNKGAGGTFTSSQFAQVVGSYLPAS